MVNYPWCVLDGELIPWVYVSLEENDISVGRQAESSTPDVSSPRQYPICIGPHSFLIPKYIRKPCLIRPLKSSPSGPLGGDDGVELLIDLLSGSCVHHPHRPIVGGLFERTIPNDKIFGPIPDPSYVAKYHYIQIDRNKSRAYDFRHLWRKCFNPPITCRLKTAMRRLQMRKIVPQRNNANTTVNTSGNISNAHNLVRSVVVPVHHVSEGIDMVCAKLCSITR